MKKIRGAPGWLSRLENATLDLRVVGLSPMVGVEITFKKFTKKKGIKKNEMELVKALDQCQSQTKW